jgi:hypothetical protein
LPARSRSEIVYCEPIRTTLVNIAGRFRTRLLVRPSPTLLAFLSANLLVGLLTLTTGLLAGEVPAIVEDAGDYCVGVQVGSSSAADTYLSLQHSGLNPVWVDFDWSNEYGVAPATTDTRRSIPPGAPTLIAFRAPALGASLQLRSSMPLRYAKAIIQHDDGTDSETRYSFLCLGQSDLPAGLY